MAEIIYTEISWTVGDIMTESKLDAMTSNDRAVDAMKNGVEFEERSAPSTPGANKIHAYAKDKSGIATLYMKNDNGDDLEVSERHSTFLFPYQDDLTVVVSATPILLVTRAMTIVKAYAGMKTAPTGAIAIFDIKRNGTSIWNATPANRLEIAIGATSGNQSSFDTVALAEGDFLTMDIAQIGSTIAGANVTVALKCK